MKFQRLARDWLSCCAVTFCLFAPPAALADWHTGKIVELGHGYDGLTVTFKLSGWSRSNCTCYSTWSDKMCLDRGRTLFKEDYAWLLRARSTNQEVMVNIDEATCKVIALFEAG